MRHPQEDCMRVHDYRVWLSAYQGFHAFTLVRVPFKDVFCRVCRLTDGLVDQRLHSHDDVAA